MSAAELKSLFSLHADTRRLALEEAAAICEAVATESNAAATEAVQRCAEIIRALLAN